MRFVPPQEAQCSQGGRVGKHKFTGALRRILNSYLGSEFYEPRLVLQNSVPLNLSCYVTQRQVDMCDLFGIDRHLFVRCPLCLSFVCLQIMFAQNQGIVSRPMCFKPHNYFTSNVFGAWISKKVQYLG